MALELQVVLTERPYVNSAELWQLASFAEWLSETEGLSKVKVNHSLRQSKLENVVKTLRLSNKPSLFHVDHPTEPSKELIGMTYRQLRGRDISHLIIRGFDRLIEHRQQWLPRVLQETSFIHGRLIDKDYNRIQNMEIIRSYESAGIDHSHLPKINNGKQPPFNEVIVDTSVNPGYWCFKKGYIEAVGSEMWLGKHFFERVNLSPDAVLACDWLETKELDNDVIHLKAYDKPFNSAEGEQRDIQFKLRELLFGNTDRA